MDDNPVYGHWKVYARYDDYGERRVKTASPVVAISARHTSRSRNRLTSRGL